MIASELAANAVAHAIDPQGPRPAIIFAIHYRPAALQITVWDNGPGQPVRTDPGPDAETGRGLGIVDALTNGEWGWWPTPRSGGKVVHATLAASDPEAGPLTPHPARKIRIPEDRMTPSGGREPASTQITEVAPMTYQLVADPYIRTGSQPPPAPRGGCSDG